MADQVLNIIVTDKEGIIKLKETMGKTMDFNKIIPQPPHLYHGHLTEEDKRDFPLNWRTWCNTNWGTKWNAFEALWTEFRDEFYVAFLTASGPPMPVIVAIANIEINFTHYFILISHNYETYKEVWWDRVRVSTEEITYEDLPNGVQKAIEV